MSKGLGDKLRASAAFSAIHNGEARETERDREHFFANRYLLSPAVTPERFTEAGLRTSIGESIDLLASPAGILLKSVLARDPTGEMLRLLDQLGGESRPQLMHDVWASKDGTRALLVTQTRAAGSDIDGQQRAIAEIRAAFEQAKKQRARQQDRRR